MLRKQNQRRAALGEKGRDEIASVAIREIEGGSVGLEDMRRSLDNQPVKLSRRNPFGKCGSESVKEVKDPLFFLVDLRRTLLQLTHLALRS